MDFLSGLSLTSRFLFVLALNLIGYLYWCTVVSIWLVRKRRAGDPGAGSPWWSSRGLRRELGWSMSTVLFGSLLNALITCAIPALGIGKVYSELDRHGWGGYLASIALVLLARDAWFYWIHRAMHRNPKLFRVAHRVHHRSIEVNPISTWSVHLYEAASLGIVYLLASLVLPMHDTAFIAVGAINLTFGVYLHSGRVPRAKGVKGSRPNPFMRADEHAWHHRYLNGNYGEMTSIWDRLMGTYHEAETVCQTAP